MKYILRTCLFYGGLIVIGGLFIFLTYETYKSDNLGFETKTYWDWMELLIIPLVLAIGAFFLQRSERAIERQAANNRAELERDIALDRQREEALQTYIDRMSELLLKEKLRTTKKKEIRDVARTRTISIMRVLDTKRNDLVIQFLREAKLVTDKNSILNGADMEKMSLSRLNLRGVFLQKANLREAHLERAHLTGAHLENADMTAANLGLAVLNEAYLWRDTLAKRVLGIGGLK